MNCQSHFYCGQDPNLVTRRWFLQQCGVGLGSMALASLLGADKAYRASLKLGERTETGDAEGAVLERSEVTVTRGDVLAVLDRFRGESEQLPPLPY